MTTLSSNKEACYAKLIASPNTGTSGALAYAGSAITSPYWYMYEKNPDNRNASGKTISSDWMALITTGAWGTTCLKADWTCTLYAAVTSGATGSCGFTPNADTTFKSTATIVVNPFTPPTYVTTGAATANAALTQDGNQKWVLKVTNASTVRVDDSVCVVCVVDGVGLYSTSTYLNLKSLAPADVLYTAGLTGATPQITKNSVVYSLTAGAVGVATRGMAASSPT